MFLVLEGGEGAGKSTQAQLLAPRFPGCLVTREPGGTPTAEAVRGLLLDPANEIEPEAEALLYAAARAEHVARVIRPALDAGRVVISDRYVHSSLAYQGFGHGLSLAWIREINAPATMAATPDVVVLLDLPVETGLSRSGHDRIERFGVPFHTRVRDGFLTLAETDGLRVVDATGPADEVAARVAEAVSAVV
jgi:dTMP kinase